MSMWVDARSWSVRDVALSDAQTCSSRCGTGIPHTLLLYSARPANAPHKQYLAFHGGELLTVVHAASSSTLAGTVKFKWRLLMSALVDNPCGFAL